MQFFFGKGKKEAKYHLVNWKVCSQTMENGCLGVGNLKNRNLALLFKWNWRFLKDPNAFWCKIVRNIHGSDSSQWHSSGKSGLSLEPGLVY